MEFYNFCTHTANLLVYLPSKIVANMSFKCLSCDCFFMMNDLYFQYLQNGLAFDNYGVLNLPIYINCNIV